MRHTRWMHLSLTAALACATAFYAPVTVYATDGGIVEEEEADAFVTDAEADLTLSGEDIILGSGSFDEYQVTDEDLPDSTSLFAGYVEQVMEEGVSGRYDEYRFEAYNAPRRAYLSETERLLYDAFSASAKEAAEGKRDSAWFLYDVGTVLGRNSFTYAELGLSSGATRAQIEDAVVSLFGGWSMRSLIVSLLQDLPYEMYWFDKTYGWYPQMPSYYYTNGKVFLSGQVGCGFSVCASYSASGLAGTRNFNTAKTGATVAAKANADAIVARHAHETDAQKLRSYRDEICALVSYHYDVLGAEVQYGDPWQLIYIFDGNPDTKVVCEGYAKGFQLLCDLSTFSSSRVECYTMTGTVSYPLNSGGTGAGPHMWNVVRMDNGLNYIADITNSDAGSTGNDRAFLKGDPSGSASGYVISTGNGRYLSYTYDTDAAGMFTDAERKLSTGATFDSDCAGTSVQTTVVTTKSNVTANTSAGTGTAGGTGTSMGTVTHAAGRWVSDANGWWYQRADGSYPVNQWEKIDGVWYRFDGTGYMQTGWVYDGAWYYLNGSGAMATGWMKDGYTWYYLEPSGAMVTGWVDDYGTWYYMNGSGAMVTGWVNDGAWYFMNGSGSMATGWVLDGTTWYYMESSGAMLANTSRDIGGTVYHFNGSGACTNP